MAFVDTLDEHWISLNAGAAMLHAQQQSAMAAGLSIAALPKGAALPIVRAMKLQWRALADAWATRRLQVAVRLDADATVVALRDFLLPPSQTAKSGRTRFN